MIDAGLSLPEPPWVIAHRGDRSGGVENGLGGVAAAVAAGVPMIEVDLQLTADDRLVVFHDWELDRLAGRPGVVEELAVADLLSVPISQRHHGVTHRGRIPTLDELLAKVPESTALNLEIKRRRADRHRLASALRVALAGRGNVLLSSFDHRLLADLGDALGDVALAPIEGDDPEVLLAAGEELGAWSLHCHRRLVDAELVAAAAAVARPLMAYTVNRADEARRLFRSGVAGIFSDRPAALVEEL